MKFSIISIISDIKAFAVDGSNSFLTNIETKAIPFILVLIRSETNRKNNDSFLDGTIVVVVGVGPVAKETVMEPILSLSSETDTKYPFSNF